MSPAVSSDSRKRSADEAELDKGQVEFEVEKQIEKKEKGAAGGVVGWDKSISLDRLRGDIRSFAAERDWEKFQTPRNLLLALVGEVGEAAEIFQWKGEVDADLTQFTDEEKHHLGEELSDVLFYLLRLADVCKIDLGKAALLKLVKNKEKYPVGKCLGKSTKYNKL